MRAAIFHQVGQPLRIGEVPDPQAGTGELVLRVASSGICGSDLHVSDAPPGLPAGTVMGHEFAGEVVEVGAGEVGAFRKGDRVCSLPFIACGRCEACLVGDGVACAQILATGLGGVPGAYAEFVRVAASETLRLPESVSYREGALVEPLSVGLHAVRKSQLTPGERVLVIGAGPIGLTTALWARFFGARSVVVSEVAPGRLALAGDFGATDGIDASRENVAAAFEKAAGGPPDVVFECVGVPGILQQSIALVRNRGRIVVVGVCVQPDTILPVMAIVKELQLIFVVAYRRQDFQLTLDMLAAERVRALPMVTESVDLDGFCSVFEALKKPTTQCKVLLEPTG